MLTTRIISSMACTSMVMSSNTMVWRSRLLHDEPMHGATRRAHDVDRPRQADDERPHTSGVPGTSGAATRPLALGPVMDIRPPRTFQYHMKKRTEDRLPSTRTSATASVAEAVGAEAIGAQAIGAHAVKVQGIGSLAISALAVGAVAIGALGLGGVVIGHLTVRRT